MPSENNLMLAQSLMTLAEYVGMSEDEVRMTIGFNFKLPGERRVRIPTQPAGEAMAALAAWSASRLLPFVKTDKEKHDQIQAAVKHLNTLTRRPFL